MNRLSGARFAALAGACALVILAYIAIAKGRVSELGNTTAKDAYYNLLVDGFRSGHLSLAKEVPAGLTQLADPYDPVANQDFRGALFDEGRVHDLTYFKGKFYLYFGATPALLLFWPWAVLTGKYLSHAEAVAIFAVIGFLAGTYLICAAWRRYFSTVGFTAAIAGVLALGLASGMPVLLNRPDVWEVPIVCAGALVMLSLASLWRALHEPDRRGVWAGLASLAYGLAVAARPSLLFGAPFLLWPALQAWFATGENPSRSRETLRLATAAILPMAAIGLGLVLYNIGRFGNAFEFGNHYQLLDDRPEKAHFGLGFLWFNFQVYFLSPAGWSGVFPYVKNIVPPAAPPGQSGMDYPFGVLANMPFVGLAIAAVPLWLRDRSAETRPLRSFVAGAGFLFATAAFTLCLFYGVCFRYEMEFTPVLALLAAFGLLKLELAFAAIPGRRLALRSLWRLLLVFSVAFNVLAGVKVRAEMDAARAEALLETGRPQDSIPVFENALRLKPDLARAQMELIAVYDRSGKLQEGYSRFGEALKSNPGNARELYDWYALELLNLGRPNEASELMKRALAQFPDSAVLHDDGGIIEAQLGRSAAAIQEFETALRLDPRLASAHVHLASLLAQSGRTTEARAHLETALQIDPGLAPARDMLRSLPTPLSRP